MLTYAIIEAMILWECCLCSW